jgi:hypothetical protein
MGAERASPIILISPPDYLFTRAASFEVVEAELGEDVYSPL